MPMALRPGTTATRADSALIERAMSSASPITARRFDAGRGLQLIQRHHRTRVALTNFAAHAEIASTPSSARELLSSSVLLKGWRSEARGAVSIFTDGSSNLSDVFRKEARGAGFLRGARATGSSSSSSISSSKSSSACGASDGAVRPALKFGS